MSDATQNFEGLRARIEEVRRRISLSAGRAGRAAEEVRLIAVTKTHPAGVLAAAAEGGARDFGENRVQEAEVKIRELGDGSRRVRWHLIGHLQSNKARRAVSLFDCVHTLDSADLASRLERLCAEEGREELEVLIQVDLAGEKTKSGVSERDLPRVAEAVGACRHLRLMGLMTLPPFFEDAELVRPYFHRLREMRDRLRADGLMSRGELSMGMSHDFEVAVEEGATMVRVGTAIFGARGAAV